jgi:phage-related protein
MTGRIFGVLKTERTMPNDPTDLTDRPYGAILQLIGFLTQLRPTFIREPLTASTVDSDGRQTGRPFAGLYSLQAPIGAEITWAMSFILQRMRSVTQAMKPVTQVMKSIRRLTKPITQVMKSILRLMKPITQVMKSILRLMEPIAQVMSFITQAIAASIPPKKTTLIYKSINNQDNGKLGGRFHPSCGQGADGKVGFF